MFLEKILAKRASASAAEQADWRRRAQDAPPARDFRSALQSGPTPRIIAEFKRASPSKGTLAEDLDPAAQARAYEKGGAVALSVLTEEHFFLGSGADLQAARAACALPVLRKDFLQHEWEVHQARAWGADAILLIAAVLEPSRLADLLALAEGLGMQALLEIHSARELERISKVSACIIGINNRNLSNFQVDLEVTRELARRLPRSCLCVSESGFFTRRDLEMFPEVHAFLIGESLVRSEDPALALRQLRGRENEGFE